MDNSEHTYFTTKKYKFIFYSIKVAWIFAVAVIAGVVVGWAQRLRINFEAFKTVLFNGKSFVLKSTKYTGIS